MAAFTVRCKYLPLLWRSPRGWSRAATGAASVARGRGGVGPRSTSAAGMEFEAVEESNCALRNTYGVHRGGVAGAAGGGDGGGAAAVVAAGGGDGVGAAARALRRWRQWPGVVALGHRRLGLEVQL